ncbi:MAG: type II toxin-antitoxin system VapC family toxin [Actinomycetota bacterium]|jgi:predicted nucleic acid-binding protein|nr:type II toxin-antitoxin system VapC family toxin [Actinomycetota bacterium]
MATRGRSSPVLVDTSAAVALCVASHEHHQEVAAAVHGRALGLSGHAAFESYSVLTRLPAPSRRPPAVVAELLDTNFPGTRHLSADGAEALRSVLADAGISGGSVYDALVGATAAEHGMPLLTLDRRASDVYRAVGVEVELLVVA